MELLKLNAKLFKIEDGETHYILSENKQQSREFYISLLDADIKKSLLEDNQTTDINECYDIVEILKDTEEEINIEEDETIYNITGNKYINVYTYAMYSVIEKLMQYEKVELPLIVASSSF